MKIVCDGETLSVSEIAELGTATSHAFKSQINAALRSGFKRIDIDLAGTGFLDCGGVGALVALRKSARHRNGNVAIRLLNPSPPVRRIFKLTRMDRVFPIERR
jgi:anti-sigma B factor antagonist